MKDEEKKGTDKPVSEVSESMDLAATANALHGQKQYTILIPSTQDDKSDVVVGVNGYVYQIQRDKPVKVPESIVSVLRNAKMTLYKTQKREDGEGVDYIPYDVNRIAFHIME